MAKQPSSWYHHYFQLRNQRGISEEAAFYKGPEREVIGCMQVEEGHSPAAGSGDGGWRLAWEV